MTIRSFLAVPAVFAAFALGLVLSSSLPSANAAIGDGREVVSACRDTVSGALRQILTGSCNGLTETAVSWRVGPEDGTELPFVCVNCALYNQSIFQGRDFTGALLTGSDFTNDPLGATNFTEAQLVNVNFTNTSLAGADFTNTLLTNTNFSGATGMDTAILTGVDWDSTTCPDGTNSEDNSDTCVGHF